MSACWSIAIGALLASALAGCAAPGAPAPEQASATAAPSSTGDGPALAASSPAQASAETPPCKGDECWTLGTKTKDEAEAQRMFRAGCDQDHATSCDFLAQMLDRPGCNSMEFDCLSQEGVLVARKGCKLGSASSCFYVAQTTRESADPVELEALYAKGCASDSDVIRTRSCPIAIDKALARSDFAAVARLSREICDDDQEGVTAGCAWYGWLLATGKGIARDEAKGRAILTSSCAGGLKQACDRKQELERSRRP